MLLRIVLILSLVIGLPMLAVNSTVAAPAASAEWCAKRPTHPKCNPTPTATPTVRPTPTASPTPTPTPVATPTPPSVTYTFRDEFSGTTIDTSKWRKPPSEPLGTEGGSAWDNSHSFVSNGMLHLVAVRKGPNSWAVPCIDTSRGLFKQRYGVFEARIKVPQGNGLWPAFWGISEFGATGGPWGPDELDFMEILANTPGSNNNGVLSDDIRKLHQVVHWHNGSQTHTGTIWSEPLSNDFHVYKGVWRPGVVEFYIDNVLTRRITFNDSDLQGAMPITLNLAVGGWPGPSDSTTPSPATMLVDWVRVSP